MNRNRLLLILGCLAAVLLAAYVTLRLTAPRSHRINRDNIDAIKMGMTEEEVEVLLGVPAGVYSPKARCGAYAVPWASRYIPGPVLIGMQGGKEWVAEDMSVYIRFDEAGLVAEIHLGHILPSGHEPFLAKLRRWLGM